MKIMYWTIIALLVTKSFAGQACFPRGWILNWSFTDKTIDFEFILNKFTIENFSVYGLGFKDPDDPVGFGVNLDDHNIIYEIGVLDRFSLGHAPTLDMLLGGSDDTLNQTYNEDTYTYTWSRPIYSEDVEHGMDKAYFYGASYDLIWAITQYDYSESRAFEPVVVGTFPVTLDDNYYECGKDFLQLS